MPDEIARAAEAEAQRTGQSLQDVLVGALEAHFATRTRYPDVDAVAGAVPALDPPRPWAEVVRIAREERLVAKHRRE